MKSPDWKRLSDYVRAHPGATSVQITVELGLANVTGRVSDARSNGYPIRAERIQGRKAWAYYLDRTPTPPSGSGARPAQPKAENPWQSVAVPTEGSGLVGTQAIPPVPSDADEARSVERGQLDIPLA